MVVGWLRRVVGSREESEVVRSWRGRQDVVGWLRVVGNLWGCRIF